MLTLWFCSSSVKVRWAKNRIKTYYLMDPLPGQSASNLCARKWLDIAVNVFSALKFI